ncbi:glycoside hydrolase family 19 protein [Sphingomonas sp. IC081]|uniref:glycoside hydrolase family 19 protein n=1 Tax=Sphingomonas sp. IC081 TaxID=304378 RepID=UPI00115AD57F|nr:glycoside hydrolase family 19 protein [Sphingomonas sp. IC081]QDK32694.1 glycoside hydrolase family 19 [Sphingomonas sp. IC081]
MLTDSVLLQAFPTMPAATRKMVLDHAPAAMERFQINTPRRVAAFLGQLAHESAGFTRMIENLNYSAKRLREVWPSRFPSAGVAAQYANRPGAIGARAYGSRMGNGDEVSGEGFKFRGRAWIMVTGRNNYLAVAKAMGMTLDETVTYLETPAGAFMASAWWWQTHRLNELADGWQITASTKVINGGENGLKDRKAKCNAVLEALEAAA